MLGTVALGQKSITAHHRQAAAPAASPFLARKEGMAAIEGEVAEAGRIGPVHAVDTGQRIINSQWRLLGQEKGREPEPAAEREVTCTNRSSEHLEDRDADLSTRAASAAPTFHNRTSPAGAALLLALLQQRVDAAHGDRQHGVGRYHLQPHAAERDEPALWRELGPVEVGTALAELSQASGVT
jgi:hypothetical protein